MLNFDSTAQATAQVESPRQLRNCKEKYRTALCLRLEATEGIAYRPSASEGKRKTSLDLARLIVP